MTCKKYMYIQLSYFCSWLNVSTIIFNYGAICFAFSFHIFVPGSKLRYLAYIHVDIIIINAHILSHCRLKVEWFKGRS